MSASYDRTLRVWGRKGGCLVLAHGNARWTAVAASRLVAGTATGQVLLFDLCEHEREPEA